jgi:hypothetical protein
MPVTRPTKKEKQEPKETRRYRDDVVMLVDGAEEGKVIMYQGSEPDENGELASFTVSGENTVGELRGYGVDVEAWVQRGLIAPLGEKAVRVEIPITDMFESELKPNDEDTLAENSGLTTMDTKGMPGTQSDESEPQVRRKKRAKAHAG